MKTLTIKQGKEKSLQRKHPWVYSGSITYPIELPDSGETVRIETATGEFIGWGAYSHYSKIRVRIWSWVEADEINRDFFRRKLQKSIHKRDRIVRIPETNCMRLVYGESDGIPGLILDRYGETLVIQSLSCGIDYWLEDIADLVIELTGCELVYERSDEQVRKLEGLQPRTGVLRKTLELRSGDIPELIEISENGIRYLVDYQSGHKTGFYLDQKENRQIVRKYVKDKDVLDCFCYTGGFALNCLVGRARSVTVIDESSRALDLFLKNVILNKLNENVVQVIQGDVFRELRNFRDKGDQFDVVILDPPKFAPTATSYQNAARGYKDINLLAMKLIKPGGVLITFSCSGGISEELFRKIIAGAAADAQRSVRIIQRLNQSQDHPVVLNYPEGSYLKGFILEVE